jgi:hypothetical protein
MYTLCITSGGGEERGGGGGGGRGGKGRKSDAHVDDISHSARTE